VSSGKRRVDDGGQSVTLKEQLMSLNKLEVAQPDRRWTERAGQYRLVVLTAIPVLAALGGVLLAWPDGTRELGLAWRLLVTVALAVGWAVLARIPSARVVATTFLAGSCIAATVTLCNGLYWYWNGPFSEDALDIQLDPLTAGTVVIFVSRLAQVLWTAVPMVLMQVFPTGVIPQWWARIAFGATLVAFVLGATLLVATAILGALEESWVWPGFAAVILFGEVTGIVVLTYRFATGSSILRRQIAAFGILQIILTAALVGSLTAAVESLSQNQISIVFVLWVLGVVACLFYGIARYRLYDMRFVVRRVGLFVLLTALLSALFVTVYLVASAALSQTLSVGSYQWLAVIGAVVVVLMVDPLRRNLVGRVEDRLLGDRHRPLRAFARLQSDADSRGGDATYHSMLQALMAAVRAPGAELALRDGPQLRRVATQGDSGEQPLAIPVSYRGESLGEIHIGRRTPGEEYPEVDQQLLKQLVAQAATQIYGVRRDQELAQTRREALTAIADERGRLGRDLHDGLAPLLAGAGLTAEALRLDLTPGSAGDRDAARLAERLRHAAGEVRRIAHGLDPGDVNENLAGAVTSYLDSLSGPDRPKFSANINVEHLPPVVANAAYLVVLEAVNNVIRHAAAHQVHVQVRHARQDLLLRVADDGRGIPQPYVSGLGITSMRKRVEALGGRFTIGTQPTGGTLIEAAIPITP
jgi:signal transduction histidine kinase